VMGRKKSVAVLPESYISGGRYQTILHMTSSVRRLALDPEKYYVSRQRNRVQQLLCRRLR